MVAKKGAFTSHEEIESLFKYQNDPSSRIHSEVQSKIKEIKDRNVTSKLEHYFKNMVLDGKGSKGSSNAGSSTLKTSIKDKVTKKMYNPLISTPERRH